MSSVALFIYGIKNLKGGGGAERFFADFFDEYQGIENSKHKLYYIIDRKSIKNLHEVDKLKSKKRLLKFKVFSNRYKLQLELLQIIRFILRKKIKIIHIPLYDASYIPLLKKINQLPLLFRPKVVINVVNCYVAQVLSDQNHKQHKSLSNTFNPLFKEVNVDGYFCWNQSFVDYAVQQKLFKYNPSSITAISSRFSDTKKFMPEEKQNEVVFASRLDEQKHADWFIKAIEKLKKENKVKNWKFILCGDGPMRKKLMNDASEKNISDVLEFKIEGQMQKILNHSRIYVSCQDYDNFPSLSMAEAMAAGNAIIARNVGQTDLFVKDKINGLVFSSDNYEGLAEALSILILNNEKTLEMGIESIKLIKEVHTVPNFVKQIDKFWTQIISTKNA
jgi:glycosyltransferase involved in cell wall biosynthesis